MGASVPISTRAFVSRSDWRARSSDCCETSSDASAYLYSHYAVLTVRIVSAIV